MISQVRQRLLAAHREALPQPLSPAEEAQLQDDVAALVTSLPLLADGLAHRNAFISTVGAALS